MTSKSELSDASLEDILNNPHKYGVPTFEEFQKNPDAYRTSKTFQLDSASNGSILLNSLIKSQTYELDGYKCKSLEEVEKVALNQGIRLDDLIMEPELEKDTAGKLICRVKFTTKTRRALSL